MTTTSLHTARPGTRVRRSAALLAVLAVAAAALSGPDDGAAAAPPDSSFDAVAASLDGVDKTSDDVAPGAGISTAGQRSSSGMHRTAHEREHRALAGYNDDLDHAERIRRRTSRPNGVDLRIAGTLADVAAPVAPIGPFAEDDGAVQLANPSGLSENVRVVRASATIGDGPHGAAGDGSGDFDFYSIADATAGQTLTVDIDAVSTGSQLDAVVAVIDPSGAILAFNDDSPELDSFLQFELPADGDYLVAVAAFGSLPTNPFDSGSGGGATSEGHYELTMSFAFAEDIDVYSVKLHRGDVLAASVTGAGRVLQLFSPEGDLVMGAGRDLSAFYPDASPLRVGGNATVDHVAAVTGRHYVMVSRGVGPYQVDVRLRRPGFESGGRNKRQILFLDFDGAFVDPSTFGTESGTLSPLEHFLAGWNLDGSDEDALINSILATFAENIEADPSDRGGNRRFAVDVRNSRDDGDLWGTPNVTRIIIGGTRDELDFDTVGLAESVDTGNFAGEETGVVLLDQASAPAGSGLRTINDFATPDTDMIGLVGRVLGFIASHEAGHLLGNWHTAPGNGVTGIMDTAHVDQLGLGTDLVFGTDDDVDVDFVTDELIEGHIGHEDTLTRVAFALSGHRPR